MLGVGVIVGVGAAVLVGVAGGGGQLPSYACISQLQLQLKSTPVKVQVPPPGFKSQH